MRLTRASSYALHALVYMAQQKTNKAIASHRIAAERGIPERFLLKVLKPLVTVLEVIEAVDGGKIQGEAPRPEHREEFPNYRPEVSMSVYRKLEDVCKTTADQIRKHLEKVKVSELVKK
jgi:DNA-binding IscR family transcriptional regulator